jgi:PadR family transcriptional regulator PadR
VDGHVTLLVLAALAGEPAHGYAVIERLRQRSEGAFDLQEGTVYPLLHRLEDEGLVASSWSTIGGRRRREYRLTRRGRTALAERRRAWESYAASVGRVLEVPA